jgi:uncharacterized protein (TIGR03435 family)
MPYFTKSAAVLWMLLNLVAQSAVAQPAFDVASIKPSQAARAGGEGSGRERIAVSPTSLTLANASLSFCTQWAYNVKFYQVSGIDKLTQQRYDIIAKTEQPADHTELRAMLKALLADRFQLRSHRETRTVPVYELVARQTGAKLRPAQADQAAGTLVRNGSSVFQSVTMPDFAERLSDLAAISRPVLDKTGLAGAFDIPLESAAREMLADPASIFAAIERAGFKLESRKAPLEVLVIDYAAKPSEN